MEIATKKHTMEDNTTKETTAEDNTKEDNIKEDNTTEDYNHRTVPILGTSMPEDAAQASGSTQQGTSVC